jgi:hypothetical protein
MSTWAADKKQRHANDDDPLAVIENDVRLFLRTFEDSDELPSDAARRLVRLVLRHERLGQAITKIQGAAG